MDRQRARQTGETDMRDGLTGSRMDGHLGFRGYEGLNTVCVAMGPAALGAAVSPATPPISGTKRPLVLRFRVLVPTSGTRYIHGGTAHCCPGPC